MIVFLKFEVGVDFCSGQFSEDEFLFGVEVELFFPDVSPLVIALKDAESHSSFLYNNNKMNCTEVL